MTEAFAGGTAPAPRHALARARRPYVLHWKLIGFMVLGLTLAVDVSAQDRAATTKVPFPTDPLASVPKLAPIVAVKTSELADVVERYQSDQGVLSRRYDGVDSPEQRTRMRGFLRRGARACARSTLTS